MASPARIHVSLPLLVGASVALPEAAVRHVQVLRLQPGDRITLFGATVDGDVASGATSPGEFIGLIERMGRKSVDVRIERHDPVQRESRHALHLAVGMPANERMDWLVEKATELGARSIQPLMTERTIVRLDASRGARRIQHWRSIAVAACEQCGRNEVPAIHQPASLSDWIGQLAREPIVLRYLLSLRPDSRDLATCRPAPAGSGGHAILLCGPEGGFSLAEEALALAQGFVAVSLGPRVLRAETAALAALTLLG